MGLVEITFGEKQGQIEAKFVLAGKCLPRRIIIRWFSFAKIFLKANF